MSKKWMIRIAMLAVLGLPVAALAHSGHTHKVMGTVSSVQGDRVEVTGTDGKLVVITLTPKTAITRGKTKLDATAVKTGERISIDYMQAKNVNTATAVKLATAPAAR
jgi:hypothetical protein